MYNKRFRPWLMRYLYPAAQEFVHRQGTAMHTQTRVSFYMYPSAPDSMRNMKESFAGLLRAAAENDVTSRLRELPCKQYLKLLPDHATQRVVRSLLLELSGSTTFLHSTFGFNVGSLHRARKQVNLALLFSAQCELQAHSVRSDLTVDGQRRLVLQGTREARAQYLTDEHSGGATSKIEECSSVGLDLIQIIEQAADQLGEFSFDDVTSRAQEGLAAVGSSSISAFRGSHGAEGAIRSDQCTWCNLTAVVNQTIRKSIPSFEMDERTLRLYCMPRDLRTFEAGRHIDPEQAAQVKARRPAAKSEDWNIDMHESSAEVAYFEEYHVRLLAKGVTTFYLPWDDHSKIEPGKKRGFASRKCVSHTRRIATAPYSDMGVKLGGAKVIINSMLFTLPPGTDPDNTHVSNSRRGGGTPVFKQAVGVVRLENERRSTPIQQFNDLRFATSMVPTLASFMPTATHAFFISDKCWDHSVRNHEIQWAHTKHHLDLDRKRGGRLRR